jgi:uncharacterized protein YqjF (DUF2071 family)
MRLENPITARTATPARFSLDDRESILGETAHRPLPLPRRPWTMQQRWNDLLFAHWPVSSAAIEATLPAGLVADTFDGWAWLGVVPFGMDQIRFNNAPRIPGASAFPELNLRTYVRERDTNRTGVYFYSLDSSNPLAVAFARTIFHLPYYWAQMHMRYSEQPGKTRVIRYRSERLFSRHSASFRAQYRGLGALAQGPIEQFLTSRYALYTSDRRGNLLRGDIHHLPWPLESAEAEFEVNELPAAHGFRLPPRPPVLHYARELVVYAWTVERAGLRGLVTSQAQTAAAGSAAGFLPRP